jgi:hypothetical protein
MDSTQILATIGRQMRSFSGTHQPCRNPCGGGLIGPAPAVPPHHPELNEAEHQPLYSPLGFKASRPLGAVQAAGPRETRLSRKSGIGRKGKLLCPLGFDKQSILLYSISRRRSTARGS